MKNNQPIIEEVNSGKQVKEAPRKKIKFFRRKRIRFLCMCLLVLSVIAVGAIQINKNLNPSVEAIAEMQVTKKVNSIIDSAILETADEYVEYKKEAFASTGDTKLDNEQVIELTRLFIQGINESEIKLSENESEQLKLTKERKIKEIFNNVDGVFADVLM